MKRRTFLKGATALTLAGPAAIGRAAAQSATTLKFVPQANLTALDPVWTTATVTSNHGYYVYDTLYGLDLAASRSLRWSSATRLRRMARAGVSRCATGCPSMTAARSSRRIVSRALSAGSSATPTGSSWRR